MSEYYKIVRFDNAGTSRGNFGHIPDAPEPMSDEYYEEHCYRCIHNHEHNGWAECDLAGCEFEEVDEE